MDPRRVDDLVRRFAEALPAGAREIGQELESTLRTLLNSAISSLNLVTREEFEVQSAVLARTRAKIEALEQQVATLEEQLGIRSGPAGTTEEIYAGPPVLEDESRGTEPAAPGSIFKPSPEGSPEPSPE
jgi:BMFP domain-containing protein YqiC